MAVQGTRSEHRQKENRIRLANVQSPLSCVDLAVYVRRSFRLL